MNKTELIEALAEKHDISSYKAGKILNSVIDIIVSEIGSGGVVELQPLCKFFTANRAARTGHNPHTGEEIQIPARTVPVIKPYSGLKKAVGAAGGED